MKKKTFVNSLIVLAVIPFSGYNVYHILKTNKLSEIAKANIQALATIEQLSSDEDGSDVCAVYSNYAYSSKSVSKSQEYIHYSGAIDRLITSNMVECTASGIGTLKGTNGIISKTIESIQFVECTGKCNY